MNTYSARSIIAILFLASCAKPGPQASDTSSQLSLQLSGVVREETPSDITEDIIPDFSRLGYHYGDDPIPDYTHIVATLTPTGDATDRSDEIEAALNLADGVTNSVVLLKAGDYYVGRQIVFDKSHLVLRGEGGGVDSWRTRIIATGDGNMSNCIRLGKGAKTVTVDGLGATEITESYVPVGRLSVCVRDASRFSPGDRVVVYRPATREWIHDIRMDQISDGEYWDPDQMHLYYERIVTRVVGERIYFDAPLVMALDADYGGGYVSKASLNRTVESGIEDIFFESVYEEGNPYDENHCHTAVKLTSCEHCWVRGVSGRYFIFSLVGQGDGSRCVTIEDCHSREPISLIQGSRRYAFNAGTHSTMALVKNCSADKDRHSFVTTEKAPGPLAFVNCRATDCQNEVAPHCFWATGILYDCLKQDSRRLSVEDCDYIGTGASHGWTGSCVVFWNCEAPVIVCQSPWQAEGKHASGRNYCIGCIGIKSLSSITVNDQYLTDRPQGEWVPDPGEGNSNTTHITSGSFYGVTASGLSLYEAQLAARKASGVRVLPAGWYQ